MRRESGLLGIVCITAILLSLIAGCTGSVLPLGGTYIYDDNETHQQWYSQHEENPEKYLTNPENPFEWTLKGMTCVASGGDDEGALEYYDIAIGLDPGFAVTYYVKGISLINLERYDEAEECFQKAVELNSDYEPLVKKHMRFFVGD